MCGIVGIYSFKKNIVDNRRYVEKCMVTMHRRGPDSNGVWHNDANYITGFVRLAIRDLSEYGNQPMLSACGNYCLTFNGEIYNSEIFKPSLIKRGVHFKSTSDTEVLLYGLIHFGIEHVIKFDGIFAFAFYDLKKNELILARDRVGIKPLYIGFDKNDSIIFSSQYDHIINYNSLKNESLDYSAIGTYLELGYVPDNSGAVNNTRLFPHGHYAVINEKGFCLKKYFSCITKCNEVSTSINEEIFKDATLSQLVSDVPVGSYLSGGVDSSLVTSWANNQHSVKAFTIGTDDDFTNEQEEASFFAKTANIEQCIYTIRESDFLKLIPDYFQSHTEPFADFSSIPSLLLSKLVGQSYKVILSGDGPDELFWGYDRNIKYINAAKKYFNPVWKLSSELLLSKLASRKTLIDKKMISSKDFYSYYYQSLFLYGSIFVPSIYKVKSKEPFFLNEICNAYAENDIQKNFIYIIRDIEMNINLQRILLKVDRSGMYNSIEVRVPYLSNKVIDAALHQCWTNHIHNGNGKFFLKQVLSKKIDHQYAFKSKKGFLVPMRNWLRESIKHDVYEKILNMPAELRVAFNQKNLQKLLDRHIVEQRDYSGIIWAVYALVNWHHYHRNAKALVP